MIKGALLVCSGFLVASLLAIYSQAEEGTISDNSMICAKKKELASEFSLIRKQQTLITIQLIDKTLYHLCATKHKFVIRKDGKKLVVHCDLEREI